jgi:hypothetical protein
MEHKLKYGDYDIAADEITALDKWIRTQRYEYRMRTQGKDSLLTPERIDLLNKIGFDWKLESQDGLTTTWLKSYQQLKAYHKEHGRRHAPQLRASDSALGKWVANQRYQHKRWKKGELPSSMTDRRRELLEDAGVVWDCRAGGQTKYDDQWQERYEQLAEFQMEHGHCFVSGNSGPLGRWISNQRKAYQNRLKYSVSTLTKKRENLLRDIGFDFDVDGFSAWQNAVWDASYKELQEFYDEHNFSNVTTPCRSPLTNWVRQQRREYRRYKEGKPCSMTPERIEALEKLNFVWTREQKSRRQTMQKYKRLSDVLNEENNGTRLLLLLLDSEMGPWIKRQGRELNRARRGKETALTEEQMKLLEELKIDELVCPRARTPWVTSLARLADFQSTHGHTRVPMSHDASLSRWTKQQRLQYHKRKGGKQSPLTPERIEKLESLGFEWTVPIGRPKVDRPPKESRRRGIPWETRLGQLIDFQSTRGHLGVSSRDDASLYVWIRQQRLEYQKCKDGKKSAMTPERIAKLESLGFEWSVTISRPRKVDRAPMEPRRRGRPKIQAS